ncbi:MAG: hypothetical protein QG629_479 [Patescibacteria group bacterium]|nr:hypothetical protein [Candidatus Saccharibacteria bacterium]MDQ5963397.1 hypothetical protein [Patescibacteria group bacterium]
MTSSTAKSGPDRLVSASTAVAETVIGLAQQNPLTLGVAIGTVLEQQKGAFTLPSGGERDRIIEDTNARLTGLLAILGAYHRGQQ